MKTSAIIIALAAFASAKDSFGYQLDNHAVVRRADGDGASTSKVHDAAWSATHVSKSHDAAWSATHVAKSQGGSAVASATAAGTTSKAGATSASAASTATPKPATYTGAASPRDIAGNMAGFVAAVVAAAAI